MTREILGKRRNRESDAIVFNGPISGASSSPVVVPSDGIVHFPTEHTIPHKNKDKDIDNDYEIDFNGSFTVKSTTVAPTMSLAPIAIQMQVTFANCGSLTKDGVFVAATSNSGIYTFPNGTQVAYSKCEVVQTLNSPIPG